MANWEAQTAIPEVATSWIFDGQAWQADEGLPPTDRGFRYGMSVFETFAVWRGRILFAQEHRIRIAKAAAAAGFVLPEDLPDFLLPEGATGMLRLYVTAGDGAPLAAVERSRILALWEESSFPGEAELKRGFRLGIFRAPAQMVLGGWKTGNYWGNVQALEEARSQGWDENLLLNCGGAIVSAAMANLAFLINDEWVTPACESGARDGVVREWLMEAGPVQESLLKPEDLDRVQECVLSNSRLGVMPVRAIDGRALASSGRADALAAFYLENVRGD